jgi:YidC/Oxa1 family membrane protein insertase
MPALPGVPVDVAYHLVSVLASLLAPLVGGLAAAGAIVVFTAAVRLVLLPLSYRAQRGLHAQARIAPGVRALRDQHAGQPDKLRSELSALYKAEGTSMFAGCLPLLGQWPFFSVMYLLFRSPVIEGARNSLLARDIFGAALGSHWLSGAGLLSGQGAVFAGLFILLAVVAWLSSRLARRITVPGAGGNTRTIPAPPAVTRLLPYLTVAVAAFLPLATGLYLLTTSAWTVGERAILARALARGRPASPQ